MIKNIKPLQFILSISLSITLTIIISIFITTAQTSSNSYLKDDLQVKTSAKFNVSGSSQVTIDTSGNVKAVGLCIGSDCKTSWYTAGTGISISGTTITNSGDTNTSDDITSLTAGTGISISGTGNTRTITNIGDTNTSDDLTSLTAGTGISISGTGNTRTITNIGDTNTSDDLTSLTAGTGISISGTGNTRTITNSQTYFSGISMGLSKSSCGNYDCYNDSHTANAFCRESGYVYGSVTSSETNSYQYKKYTWVTGWTTVVDYGDGVGSSSKIRGLACYR